LIGLLLPLSFLFSLDSQLKFASPRETIALYAILFVVYLLAAVLCAAVLRFVVWLLVLCGVPSRRSTTLLRGLQLIGSAVLCTACLLFFARIWCDTIGISGNGRIWRLATLVTVIGVAGAIIWRLCQNRRRRLLGMGAAVATTSVPPRRARARTRFAGTRCRGVSLSVRVIRSAVTHSFTALRAFHPGVHRSRPSSTRGRRSWWPRSFLAVSWCRT
jgi:hypothetical protein